MPWYERQKMRPGVNFWKPRSQSDRLCSHGAFLFFTSSWRFLPSPVQPPILFGCSTNHVFQPRAVPLGKGPDACKISRQVGGICLAFDPNFKLQGSTDASTVDHEHGRVAGQSKHRNGFVAGGRSAEKIDPTPFFSGVLVGEQCQGLFGVQDVLDSIRTTLFR